MALIQCDFFSETLGLSTSMTVILPQSTRSQIGMEGKAAGGKHPTLYLLHGLSDDHTIWLRRTSIERYVAHLGLAVVMPAVHRSYYTNMAEGLNYWTFVSEELPALARSFFPLSSAREDNFAAGLSMGGYGAFKLALRRPEQFSAAASLSGALDAYRSNGLNAEEVRRIFGEPGSTASDNDLFVLAEQGAAQPALELPKLYQCCGTEDFLYHDNIRFRDHAARLGLDLTYEEGPGTHEWGYWDEQIRRVLDWLPLRK
ncbi:alpha/beta hydrolase [Paenibacillus chartarius]|uniref:Alpha/beta hydrolase n=1 Tax=Paenibacillus chartarius TaxID=747481 RepID=A0ABV6DU75_9BACL